MNVAWEASWAAWKSPRTRWQTPRTTGEYRCTRAVNAACSRWATNRWRRAPSDRSAAGRAGAGAAALTAAVPRTVRAGRASSAVGRPANTFPLTGRWTCWPASVRTVAVVTAVADRPAGAAGRSDRTRVVVDPDPSAVTVVDAVVPAAWVVPLVPSASAVVLAAGSA